jgi:hypothetical protein
MWSAPSDRLVFRLYLRGWRSTLREAKGAKDRKTIFPLSLIEPLKQHLPRVKALHKRDLRAGFGEVYLPYALARKYPNAGREWMLGHISSYEMVPVRFVRLLYDGAS